jgi:phosphoglycerate dehydrogenase-like enzyme
MKLLITARWDEEGLKGVEAAYPQVEFLVAKTPEEVVEKIAEAEVVFGWPDRAAILAGKKLCWVQAHSAGMDWLTGNTELIESDLLVTNMGVAFAATMVEHSFAMLLSLTRGLRHFDATRQGREWPRPLGIQPVGLAGMTLGVIALGNVGRGIGRVGHAMGMQVIAVDANEVPLPDYVESFWRMDGIPELLRRSDVVMVSCPLTEETKGLLGRDMLGLMKPSSYLIVISRGGIVDEQSLVAMLREGRLAGAGLDVAEVEPPAADSGLWEAPNLVLTPHCSGVSNQTSQGCWDVLHENLGRYLAGKSLINKVDKRRGY